MKILQLIYSLSSGGAERFVVDLCNRLGQNIKDEIILVTVLDDNKSGTKHYLNDLSKSVRYINLHCTNGLSPLSIWRIYRIITQEKPDIVHCHSNLLLLYLAVLIYHKPKYIHTLHNLANYCLEPKWVKPINKYLYKHKIKPITISKECNDSFENLYNLTTSICITNGREPLKKSENIIDDFISNNNVPVFIHVARCSPQKNQHRLFKAFERLYSEGIKFELMCVGSNYNKYLIHYRNHPSIHILGEKKNVGDYMSLSDFFILSSDFEGLPLTLLEAMSLGITPISTPAGGVVDVIEDGRNGYMSSDFSDESFYLKIKQAIAEKGKIKSDIIKKDYIEHYSMEVCADKYYNAFKQLL